MSLELLDEINLELAQLRQLMESFQFLRSDLTARTPTTVETIAAAGYLHSFYTGVENIFKRISFHLDGGPLRGENWHSRLLDSMAVPNQSRPAVISGALRDHLYEYLNFRHVFRHAYSFHLQWSKMASLVAESEHVWILLKTALQDFIKMMTARKG